VLGSVFPSLCERSNTINTQPLTHRNFVSVVSSLVVGGVLVWATPSDAQVVAPEVATQSETVTPKPAGTARQQAWLKATVNQRVKLAEQIGDEGARAFAKAKGWSPVFDGTARGVVQGPDQVYLAVDGTVHLIDGKGGKSPLGRAYGYAQGSSEWAVESAKRVLRSPAASEAERRGAALVLEAAAKGNLQVHVVRTSHVLGEPTAAVLEQTAKSTDEAARLAASGLDDLGRSSAQIVDDVARASDNAARAASTGGTVLRATAKVAVPVAVAADGGLRIRDGLQTERQFQAGEISEQEREVAHAKNAAGMAGGWGGALAGGKLGAVGGAAAGSAVAPGPGTAVGGVAGGITGGVAGYIGGEAAAEASAEWAVDRVHAAGTTVGESAEAAWNGAADAVNSAAGGINRAWSWVRGN
jgi:hypothetical protein